MGEGKKINPQDYVNAWNILNLNSWFSISHVEDRIDMENNKGYTSGLISSKFSFEFATVYGEELILHADSKSEYIPPDVFALRKLEFDKMSDFAKEIINTICYAPPEVIDQLESRKRIKEKKVFDYFKKKWGDVEQVKKAISEVRCFSLALK